MFESLTNWGHATDCTRMQCNCSEKIHRKSNHWLNEPIHPAVYPFCFLFVKGMHEELNNYSKNSYYTLRGVVGWTSRTLINTAYWEKRGNTKGKKENIQFGFKFNWNRCSNNRFYRTHSVHFIWYAHKSYIFISLLQFFPYLIQNNN